MVAGSKRAVKDKEEGEMKLKQLKNWFTSMLAFAMLFTILFSGGGQAQAAASAVQVAAGDSHTLMIKEDGTLVAFGRNNYGQLGINNTIDQANPATVNLTGATAVDANANYSLVLKSDGTVWAFGQNESGQLGNGTTVNSKVPVQVQGLDHVVAISAGMRHAVAVKSDGTVWAWGYNGEGELGNGTKTNSKVPVQVQNISDATYVDAGRLANFAIKVDGTAVGWGYNGSGILGNGTNVETLVPTPVKNLTNLKQVVSDGSVSYALTNDGTVYKWGLFSYWQSYNVPRQEMSGVSKIFSRSTTFYIMNDGTVYSEGGNNYCQRGDSWCDSDMPRDKMQYVTNAQSIAVGGTFTLVTAPNRVLATGSNTYGQFGDGTHTSQRVPHVVYGQQFLTLTTEATTTSVKISFSDERNSVFYVVMRPGMEDFYTTHPNTFVDEGLKPGTTYEYTLLNAVSYDSEFEYTTIKVTTLHDVQANATATSSSSIDLSWTNVAAAAKYVVKRDGAVAYEGAAASFTDTGLNPSTAYNYDITAYDAKGTVIGRATASATTLFELTVTSVNAEKHGVNLSYTGSAPVGKYVIKRDGTVVYEGTDASFSDTGLNASTTYDYTVEAYDADGALLGSKSVQVTTPFELTVSTNVPDHKTVELTFVPSAPVAKFVVKNEDGVLYEGADTHFTDTKLKNKHTYTYNVEAYDENGQLQGSATVSAYTTQK
jgi:hypothetical protein